ncbi:hypothetical protein ACQ4PT_069554 [Festuca glaucescens]
MGNILNQILATTTRHPKQNYQARIADDQFRLSNILFCRATLEHTRCVYNKGVSDSHFELWSVLVSRALSGQARRIYKKGATNDHFRLLSILVCRAISECIRRKLIVYEKGVAIDRFQLWRILICRTMSYFIGHKTIYEKRIADAQFQLLTLSICKAISDYLCCRSICKKEISVDRFVNLPEDVLRTILSKLPLDECAHKCAKSDHESSCQTTEATMCVGKFTQFFSVEEFATQAAFHYDIDGLSLVKFLGATPFIEKLEMHFTSLFGFFYVERTTIRRFEHEQKYLKDVSITGFKASIGQVELLVHIVENTPALDVLTIDQSDRFRKEDAEQEEADNNMDERYGVIRTYIEGKVSPECFVRLL